MGYTLHIYNTLLAVETDTPCTFTLRALLMDTPCKVTPQTKLNEMHMSKLLGVQIYTADGGEGIHPACPH
jgi:hypothetical protein